ncbi:NAD(P)-dependent alcohol dehydrogenase [Pseudactinotalea sp. HY158]|uniref:NAD(P)-dependent alcohol dehydrogenase n=1 Tax=Pseudactinotalea sp. HY158 TaxID=2654547 RepID=UPI00129CBBC0|nr:NAD(P)-dependent alcohol dehydrogenase [Pseudactinotalea sp. HY158]QGH70104.1 alcohol dehydrogenase catalytic domain-containing protein [Pseudactinotalea sp. HY158]
MTALPPMMRASVLTGVGSIALEERPVPTPDPDQVLIQVASVGVCGSDVHYYEHGRIGDYVVDAPLVLGHELSGTIVAVGSAVDPARVGRRVAVEPQRACRTCDFCRAGQYNLCPDMEFYATPPIDGAFCEYVTIQDDFAFEVPEQISDHAAALMEPLSVGIAAAQKSGLSVGETILIAGAGPIGILTAQVARAYGAAEVIVSDLNPLRRELALSYGATRVIDPLSESTEDLGAHVFVDASGAVPAILSGIKSVRAGGQVILVGSVDEFPLSVADIAMREVNVTGTFRYTNTWPIARALLESGAVEVDSLVTHVYGLEQVEDALRADDTPDSLKRIVLPGVARVEDPSEAAERTRKEQ